MDRGYHTSPTSPHPRQAADPLRADAFYIDDLAACPTPGEIVGQIGRVIAVCLALALLARAVVAVIGVY